MIKTLTVKLQVVGQIDNQDPVKTINNDKYKIFQGDKLSENTTMYADNYYIQSGAFVLPK